MCLFSKHVDVNPGDRAATCAGLLKPKGYYKHKSKGFMILYQCQTCSEERRTKFLETDKIQPDSYDALLKLTQLASKALMLIGILSIVSVSISSSASFAQSAEKNNVFYNSEHEVELPNLKNQNEARLLVVGDTGTGDTNQRAVANLLNTLCVQQNVDAVLLLGDNFYTVGVETEFDAQWKTKFEEMYSKPCLEKIPFFTLLGNHDYDGSPGAQVRYSKLHPQKFVLPSRYYFASLGKFLGIAVADSNIPDFCGISFLCSVDWLKEKLVQSPSTWNIVAAHHPVLTFGKYKNPQRTLWTRRFVLPFLFCEPKSDAFIAAHDHNMQHNIGKHSNTCDTNQFVIGSGGGELYPVEAHAEKTKFSASEFGAGLIRAGSDTLEVSFYSVNKLVSSEPNSTEFQKPIYSWKKTK
jgi:tartrate-resistant acid phosphatase type 5